MIRNMTIVRIKYEIKYADICLTKLALTICSLSQFRWIYCTFLSFNVYYVNCNQVDLIWGIEVHSKSKDSKIYAVQEREKEI